jgi:hypothetical protein
MIALLCNGLRNLAILGVLAIGASVPAFAQENLRALGSVTYKPRPVEEQRGIFLLRSGEDVLRALRIESVGGSAEIIELRLVYRGGETERIRMGDRLRPGAMTNTVRSNDPRPLRQVEVAYIPAGAVTLVLRADTKPPEPPKPVLTWAQLGCKNVGFFADQDVVTVYTPDAFRAVRLRSSGFDIEMLEMGVVYVNGQKDIYRINTLIPSGGFTSAIDLRGERRRIRQIELSYSTRVLSSRKTQLCVEGLRETR